MFKFRRSSSLCSPSKEQQPVSFHDEEDDNNSPETSARSVKKTQVATEKVVRSNSKPEEGSKGSGSSSSNNSNHSEMTKWSFSGDKIKANFKKSFIGQVMCDRKRKERQESVSQEDYCAQEKKVVRSVSDDEGVHVPEKGKGRDLFKRTLSHDDFGKKSDLDFDNNVINTKKEEILKQNKAAEIVPISPSVLVDRPETNMMRKVDYSSVGDYEPEAQRQLERFVNYSAGTSTPTKGLMNNSSGSSSSKSHRRRHKSSRHHHSSESSTGRASSVDEEEEEEIGIIAGDDTSSPDPPVEIGVNGVAGSGGKEETHEEVDSPLTEESSSSSEDSVKSIPLVLVEEDDSTSGNGRGNPNGDFQLDFSTMHHQIETSQPISFLESIGQGSNDQVMLSPRSGFLIKDAMDLPPSPPMYQIQLDPPLSRQSLGENNELNVNKINSLTKQVGNLKRTLKLLEEEYEQMFGYRPSKSDRIKNREMKKVIFQLAKAKKELKELKEDPAAIQEANLLSSGQGRALLPSRGTTTSSSITSPSEYILQSLQETVKEIEEVLGQKRRLIGRNDNPEKMSGPELLDEKSAMQKQLLILEKRHGRPSSKQEKDIVRPLYEHYRIVKKLSGRLIGSMKEPNVLDLVPIMENETLDNFEGGGGGESSACSVVEIRMSPKAKRLSMSRGRSLEVNVKAAVAEAELLEEEREGGDNESFSEMNVDDLEKRLRQAKEEKRKFRSTLRRFETEFQEVTGRPPLKEEKKEIASGEMEGVYGKYKRVRATIRLLEVLINKKKFPHLLLHQDPYQIED